MDDRLKKAPGKYPGTHPEATTEKDDEAKSPGIYNPLTETADFRPEMNDGNPQKEPKVVMPPPHKGHGGKYEPRI